MTANLRKFEIPNSLHEFFKQTNPDTTYLVRGKGYLHGAKPMWRTVKVVLDFENQKFGFQIQGGSFQSLKNMEELKRIAVTMYEIDELFDMIAGENQ